MKTLLSLIVLAALSLGLTSCGSHPKLARAEQVFVDCGKADLATKVETAQGAEAILAAVLSVFASGGADWQASLEAFGKQAGQDALACAVKAAESLLAASSTGSAASTAALSPAMARAQAFLAAHPEWAFVSTDAK